MMRRPLWLENFSKQAFLMVPLFKMTGCGVLQSIILIICSSCHRLISLPFNMLNSAPCLRWMSLGGTSSGYLSISVVLLQQCGRQPGAAHDLGHGTHLVTPRSPRHLAQRCTRALALTRCHRSACCCSPPPLLRAPCRSLCQTPAFQERATRV